MHGEVEDVTMDKLWTWANLYGLGADGDFYLRDDKCIDFEKEICFDLGKSTWKKHWSVLQDHVKYIHNVKPFRVLFLKYGNCVCKMNEL